MTKWIVFLVYWFSLVMTMRQGDLWMWLILLPTFLLLWAWAEELDSVGPAVRTVRESNRD